MGGDHHQCVAQCRLSHRAAGECEWPAGVKLTLEGRQAIATADGLLQSARLLNEVKPNATHMTCHQNSDTETMIADLMVI